MKAMKMNLTGRCNSLVLGIITALASLKKATAGFEISGKGLLKDTGVDDHGCHEIGVDVGCRSAILDIALTVSVHGRRRDTD